MRELGQTTCNLLRVSTTSTGCECDGWSHVWRRRAHGSWQERSRVGVAGNHDLREVTPPHRVGSRRVN